VSIDLEEKLVRDAGNPWAVPGNALRLLQAQGKGIIKNNFAHLFPAVKLVTFPDFFASK
jgi:hypothetical protein